MLSSNRQSRNLVALYALLLMLILTAVVNPSAPWSNDEVDLVVLLDDSLSMKAYKSEDKWDAIDTAVGSLPAGSRMTLLGFATTTGDYTDKVDKSVRSGVLATNQQQFSSIKSIDKTSSNFEYAVNHALRISDPDRNNVFLVISDFQENRGNAINTLNIAKQGNITVLGYKPLLSSDSHKVIIKEMAIPTRAKVGQKIPINVTLTSSHNGKGQFQLLVDGIILQETVISLNQGNNQFRLWHELENNGANLVELRMRALINNEEIFGSRKSIVNVQGIDSILYVSGKSSLPALIDILNNSHIDIHHIQPFDFPANDQALRNYTTIILDDVPIYDMNDSAWSSLKSAVKNNGAGLIVLGGPNSFGYGGYRHSALEEILPVTAQSRQKQQPVSVQFLIDKSGSMDNDPSGMNRLSIAQQSVIETCKTLNANDNIGIIAFDTLPHELLPIRQYHDLLGAVEKSWVIKAGGGTNIEEALKMSIDKLSTIDTPHKYLVLITDGFVDDTNIYSLIDKVQNSNVDIIAISVGSDVNTTTLNKLVNINNGKLLSVNKIATLPRILRNEVEQRLNPAVLSNTEVIPGKAIPFLSKLQKWPPLKGYTITSAKTDADIYLQSKTGDPLLVTGHAGSGKVMVLPGGLGTWAGHWRRSTNWEELITGIINWISPNNYEATVIPNIVDGPGFLNIMINVLNDDLTWKNTGSASATISDPTHQTTEIKLEQSAPGQYQGTVTIDSPGRYKTTLRIGDKHISHELLHGTYSEFDADPSAVNNLSQWQEEGLIKLWAPGQIINNTYLSSSKVNLRGIAMVSAIILYLLIMLYERGIALSIIFHRFITTTLHHMHSMVALLNYSGQNRIKRDQA